MNKSFGTTFGSFKLTEGKFGTESFSSEHKVFELPWLVKKVSTTTKMTVDKLSNKENETQQKQSCYLLPHELKQECFHKNTWTWFLWSIKNQSPITGRIARSLQRSGLSILIGGFTAFLPYKEYSIRNKIICAKEAELQSFQILSLKRSNLNCVLSKDRVTYQYDRDWMIPSQRRSK